MTVIRTSVQCIKDYLVSPSDIEEDFIKLGVALWNVLRVLKLQHLLEALAVVADNVLTFRLSVQVFR